MPDLSGASALQTIQIGYNRLSGALPPAPATSSPGASMLCPNQLHAPDATIDAEWNIAAGNPWWGYAGGGCDEILISRFDPD